MSDGEHGVLRPALVLQGAERQVAPVSHLAVIGTPEAAAIAKCEAGDYAAGIPTLEDALIAAKIPLPAPGYRWPGRPIGPT